METNSPDFAQKLAEKYRLQCLQFFQEILSLQVQIELKDEKIKELESKLADLEASNNEELNVNSTLNT